MKIDVFAVSFHGRFVDRDDDGYEKDSRIGTREQTVLAGALTQADAVSLVAVVPDGQEPSVTHVSVVARDVVVSPRALRRAEAEAEKVAKS